MRIFAYSTAAAVALAAFAAAPALSADYNDYRYGDRYERGYQVPVPVPQYGYDHGPREYRVIVYPVKRRGYHDYEQSGYPVPYPNGGYYNGAPYGANNYIPNGNGHGYGVNGNGYEQGYRDGVADAVRGPNSYGAQPYVRAEPYARAEYEGGVLLPPAPVGPPRRAVYAPGY